MTPARRSAAILVGLIVTLASASVFVWGTDGFYGTAAPTYWQALHPLTVTQSDDVYRCNSLNGLGTDEEAGAALLVLLFLLVPLRAVCFHWQPPWWEVALFGLLSVPSLLFYFAMSYCADIPLTIIVGHSLTLATCIAGWFATLGLYLLPGAKSAFR